MKAAAHINLASEPFRRDRPMLVASIATAVLMTAVLAMLGYLISIESGAGRETAAAIAETERQIETLATEEATLRGELLRPENEVVLDRSLFLNALLVRKGISWTLIFQDLEGVLPFNVKLVQVRPELSGLNEIQLEMVVAAQTAEPVIEMLRAMESSPVFSAVELTVTMPPTDTEPLYRYRLNVNYDRRL